MFISTRLLGKTLSCGNNFCTPGMVAASFYIMSLPQLQTLGFTLMPLVL